MFLLLFSSCTLAPEYQRPLMPVAESFSYPAGPQDGQEETEGDFASLYWKEIFTDPGLQQLIVLALENNRSLRETALTVEAYQARYRIQRSSLLPTVTGDAYGLKQRTLSSGGSATSELYSVEVGIASWELDFFGRIRNLEQSALEQYLAMEASRRSAEISLVSEVAAAYLSLLADQELLRISENTQAVEKDSYALIKQRVDAGISNRLDLAQARTSLETVNANLARYRRLVAQDRNYLALLTGAPMGETLLAEERKLSDILPLEINTASLSSRTLLQRPDIMAAEHELKGANAEIGAARAAFFPSISLTTSTGFISSELGDLFQGGSWLFSPSVRLPIFTAGKLKAELDSAEIQKNIYVTRYERAIQTAFREVSDVLAGLSTYEQQLSAQKANLLANQEYYDRAKERYNEGIDSFLTLLDAQRSLYSSKQNYINAWLAQLANQVNLYKALAGNGTSIVEG